MTEEELREEYTKCLKSPAYFYNNYVLVKDANGNITKPNPVTDEQMEAARYVDVWQRRLRNP